MRYQELKNKEIIDLNKGRRLGLLGQTDLDIDQETGKIHAFKIDYNRFFNFNNDAKATKIQWDAIKKIGTDTIIIDRFVNPK
ncbi:sporulation protein, YlmC/YmxH family [Pelagirhabdus alkalitolerans]|uniref:Sporulation protein, YlmC/YmxH family n=1 Tax=Pelagirhabdus alkalitolerans TaxID=1612202 RepID=A0A1G6H490_9BACI|nr:YlmC/YmxH family sporulation protein [Pelagirhabdus alkalitolerans]SDB89110.1 sporulation protein, YlmC/YmxH family [Pelagirhabdus alkalitolerans]